VIILRPLLAAVVCSLLKREDL